MAELVPKHRACSTSRTPVYPRFGALPQSRLGDDVAVLYLRVPGPAGQNPFSPHPPIVGEIPCQDISFEKKALELFHEHPAMGYHVVVIGGMDDYRIYISANQF